MHRALKAKESNSSSDKDESFGIEQKDGLMQMAQLIYDIYKERQENDKIEDGQNNANQTHND